MEGVHKTLQVKHKTEIYWRLVNAKQINEFCKWVVRMRTNRSLLVRCEFVFLLEADNAEYETHYELFV